MNNKIIVFCMASLVIAALVLSCSPIGSNNNSEYNKLKADIAVIESVQLDNLKEFNTQNSEWIADLNNRIEKYLSTIPEDQRSNVLMELRGNKTTRSAYDYFSSYQYHYRGGYWTYSMSPYLSTRLLRPYAAAGWNELAALYSGIRYDSGSLYNQYWCHFEAFIEAGWDIEEGRPNVGLLQTILCLCNP